MIEELERLQKEKLVSLSQAKTENEVSDVRVGVLGRKGSLTQLLKSLGALPEAERRELGKRANQVKAELEAKIEEALIRVRDAERREALRKERVDITLPGRPTPSGKKHPVTQILDEVVEIFSRLGFDVVEGLLVDKGVTFADLKGVLTVFIHQMFGEKINLRFRPSFFPFTEPSAEVDIQCMICGGKGCGVCSNTGWLEILGSGMVDPAVYRFVHYDPEEVTGFAFGMGLERIAMLKFGINDIRLFFTNDLRFLKQF